MKSTRSESAASLNGAHCFSALVHGSGLRHMMVVMPTTRSPTRTEFGSPLFEIVDAVHNSGNEHFFFLPPMVIWSLEVS